MTVPVLDRRTAEPPAGEFQVRMVHLGVGAFARSLPLWLTHRVNHSGSEPWGVAAFTGRTPHEAALLSRQDGLYHLLTRSDEGDVVERVDCVQEAVAGDQVGRLALHMADSVVTMVTTTVTEAGYAVGPSGGLDHDALDVKADRAVLSALLGLDESSFRVALDDAALTTAPYRLIAGLELRRRAGHGVPVAIVPCDNLAANGRTLRRVLFEAASGSEELMTWLESAIEVADTVVDRITPAAGVQDREIVRQISGFDDRAAVVTEPYFDVTIAGQSTLRPAWEAVGGRAVDDVEPYERRKLWLLNGAHTLLAHAGRLRGHRFVHEAVMDPELLGWLQRWWDEASAGLPQDLNLDTYRDSLLRRFANQRLPHRLDQIAIDTEIKLGIRVVPVVRQGLALKRAITGGLYVLAAWAVDTAVPGSADNIDDRFETLAPGLLDHIAVRDQLEQLIALLNGTRREV